MYYQPPTPYNGSGVAVGGAAYRPPSSSVAGSSPYAPYPRPLTGEVRPYSSSVGVGYQQQYLTSSGQGQQRPPVVTMQAPEGDLIGWFNSVDTDRSGRIDAVELSQALRRGGINLSPLGAARVIAMFDTNGSGQISFPEFQQLHPFVQHMAKTFKLRDRNGNGRIEPREVSQMLAEGGYGLDAATFQTLIVKFDSENKGWLGFEDFVQMKVFLHNVKKIFGYYDVNKSGRVLFTTDSFLEAAVAAR